MSTMEVVARDVANIALSLDIVDEFRTAMRGEVLTQESGNYDDVRLLWNGKYHDKRPGLIARCLGVADVITAVNFASEHNLLVAVRGGGHNVGGTASCNGGIMIDLSLMKGVHVDPKGKTARVKVDFQLTFIIIRNRTFP